jgi:hypothetical protein
MLWQAAKSAATSGHLSLQEPNRLLVGGLGESNGVVAAPGDPIGLLFAGTLQGSLEEASRLQLSQLLGYEDERFLQGASLH